MRNRACVSTAVAIVLSLAFITATTTLTPSISSALGVVTQNSPLSGTTSVVDSASFTDTLSATGDGSAVTFTPTSTAALTVNAAGHISTTGSLAAGPYTISGIDQDADNDPGSWSYTLNVTADTIAQGAPTSGSVDVAGSTTFSANLAVASGSVNTVTYSPTSVSPGLNVSASGAITTVSGPLAASTYTATGTDADNFGDNGSWTYTLTVTPDTITQTSPTSGSTTAAALGSFSPGTITTANNSGAVHFVTTVTSPDLSVSTSGVISITGSPAIGSYTVSGTDSDSLNDTGSWTYMLSVTQSGGGGGGGGGGSSTTVLTQTSPTFGSTTPSASATYKSAALTASGATGAVTFVATSTAKGLALINGAITTTGALASGTYVISGTDSDTHGDTGTWTFSLTVSVGALVQTSRPTATTTVADSKTFAPGAITVSNGSGPVTFITIETSPALTVSSGGVIATTGKLKAGSYNVSGTDADNSSDTGTWSFSLTVTGSTQHVKFDANGGHGTMREESAAAPRALTLDLFTRAGFSFAGWATQPNGHGKTYANGITYSFSASMTLYAQWRAGKAVAHTVTFNANAGAGFMARERASSPQALSNNRFTRPGYTFERWSTSANGRGAGYANDAVYSFHSSTTLYAQWTKRTPTSRTVTFNPNGGHGAMNPEKGAATKALTPDHFTRTGYTFLDWNTSPAGKGAIYTNGAHYSFATSVTLYAQWKKAVVVVLPPVKATGMISPFSAKSSTLSTTLESEISSLALTAKSDRDTSISLVGFGDKLSKAEELNEALWSANYTLSEHRANAVASYLRERLAALGLTGVSVTASGSGSAIPGSSSSSKYRLVVASLT